MLTTKQQELLFFIRETVSKRGLAPTFEEMKDGVGLKSKSGIHRLILALEERGFIKRLPGRRRAIQLMNVTVENGRMIQRIDLGPVAESLDAA